MPRCSDQFVLNVPGSHIRKFVTPEYDSLPSLHIAGEKLRHRHGKCGQDFLQRTDGGTDPVLLDQRHHTVGNPGAPGQFALAQTKRSAHHTQLFSDFHACDYTCQL